jgi:hypothetical protein
MNFTSDVVLETRPRKSDLSMEPQVQIRVGEAVQPCGSDVLQADAAQTMEEADFGA